MALAKTELVEVEVIVKKQIPGNITLTLTQLEASAVYLALGRIGGGPKSLRDTTADIYYALGKAINKVEHLSSYMYLEDDAEMLWKNDSLEKLKNKIEAD